jgi:hypothetical protein
MQDPNWDFNFGNNIGVNPRTLTDPLRNEVARLPNFWGQF